MSVRKCFKIMAVMAFIVSFAGTQAAAAEFQIRFAHDGAPDAVYSQVYRKFAELASTYTKGKVEVKMFENAVLGGDREVTESTQRGDLQMGGCGTSNIGIFWSSGTAFDLPFLISPAKKAKLYKEMHDGKLGQYFNDQLAKVNLVALVWADCPSRHYVTNKKPIPSLESLRGIKMRTTASPVDNYQAEVLKMTPAPMGFGEIYTALQQGTIDGELLSLADYFTCLRGEVIHYVLPTAHSYTAMIGLINKQYWDSLPADIQGALKKAAVEANAYGQQLIDKLEKDALDYGKKNKLTIHEFPPDMRAAFIEAVKPVYDKFVPTIDPEFYTLLTATQK